MTKMYGILLALLLPLSTMPMEKKESKKKGHGLGWYLKAATGTALVIGGTGAIVVTTAVNPLFLISLMSFLKAPGLGVAMVTSLYGAGGAGVVGGALIVKSLKKDLEQLEDQPNNNEQPARNEINLDNLQMPPNWRQISFKKLMEEPQHNEVLKEIDNMRDIEVEVIESDIPLIVIPHEIINQNVASDEEFKNFMEMSVLGKGHYINYSRRFRELSEFEQDNWTEIWRDEKERAISREWARKNPRKAKIKDTWNRLWNAKGDIVWATGKKVSDGTSYVGEKIGQTSDFFCDKINEGLDKI